LPQAPPPTAAREASFAAPWPWRPLACCDILLLATRVPPSPWRQPLRFCLPPPAFVPASLPQLPLLGAGLTWPSKGGWLVLAPATTAGLRWWPLQPCHQLPPLLCLRSPFAQACNSLRHHSLSPSLLSLQKCAASTKSLRRGLHWPSPLAQLLA
jgi:hypothetical protein